MIRKYFNKKKRKGGKLVTVPRGGFVPAARGWVKPTIGGVNSFMRRAAEDYWKRARSSKFSIDDAQKFFKSMNADTAFRVGKTAVEMVAGKVSADETRLTEKVPSISRSLVKSRFAGGGNPDAKLHNTIFHVGKPTTASIRRLEKLAGSEIRTISSTMRDPNYRQGTTRRGEMELFTGFNQKAFLMYDEAHISVNEILNLYYPSPTLLPQASTAQRIYGLAKWMKQKYTILSNSSYYAQDLKIHVYAPRSAGYSSNNVFAAAFTSNLAGTQAIGRVPEYYQLDNLQNGTDRRFCLVDPKCQLEMSPRFNARFSKVKTFSRRLLPGDVWDFSLYDHLGSGLRLDYIAAQNSSSSLSIVSYVIVIETKGSKCQAWGNLAGGVVGDSYIGTAPCSISVEHETQICAVRALDTGSLPNPTTSTDVTEGGMVPSYLAIRTFMNNEAGPQIVNYPWDSISTKGGPVGTVFIPVMADNTIEYASPVSLQ